MKVDKEVIIDLAPPMIAVIVGLLVLANFEEVKSDPYLMGLADGFFWPTLVFTFTKAIYRA